MARAFLYRRFFLWVRRHVSFSESQRTLTLAEALKSPRDQRSRAFTQTELTSIPGVGEKTATKLLKEIGSVKKVRESSLETLQALIGKSAGQKVYDFYRAQMSGVVPQADAAEASGVEELR